MPGTLPAAEFFRKQDRKVIMKRSRAVKAGIREIITAKVMSPRVGVHRL